MLNDTKSKLQIKMENVAQSSKKLKLDHNIYFPLKRIQKKRHEMMVKSCRKMGFSICTEVSMKNERKITHVVCDCDNYNDVLKMIPPENSSDDVCFVYTSWLSECLKKSFIVDCDTQFLIPQPQIVPSDNEVKVAENLKYACQKSTPLIHPNRKITDALEMLELDASFSESAIGYSRALAFRRASCSIKTLQNEVAAVDEVVSLRDIGKHSLNVIKEIVDYGHSKEVEQLKKSKTFSSMQLFTGVFGIGPATARKAIQRGCETIDDLRREYSSKTDKRILKGLEYYEDLSEKVSLKEARLFEEEVKNIVSAQLPNTIVKLVGGFSRGKDIGHDVDLLMTHTNNETKILPILLKHLSERILYGAVEASTFKPQLMTADTKLSYLKSSLDHFEKWIGILRIQSRAVRVDLIVAPFDQYYYALVGWIGSKHFNRSLRLYAQNELDMKLTSHGLYDNSKMEVIHADSEEKVFENLKLSYLPPHLRNC